MKASLKSALLLTFGLFAYYLAVVYAVGFFADPARLIYRYPDPFEYRELADWIFGLAPESQMIARRTFLYPLFLGLSVKLGGELGIWVLQMVLWVASGLLYYFTFLRLGVSKKWLWAAMVGLFLTITPIYLSTIAVTEPLAYFFFAIAAFVASGPVSAMSLGILCFVSGLLVVVKPNYAMLFGLMMLFSTFLAFKKGWLKNFLPWLGLAILPLYIQLELNNQVIGKYALSSIGQHVIKVSLYAEVLDKVYGSGLVPTHNRLMEEHVETDVIFKFLAQHPFYTLGALLRNLEENLRTVFELNEDYSRPFHFFRKQVNGLYYWLHILFFVPMLVALFKARKFLKDLDAKVWLFALYFAASLLPTGMVCGQATAGPLCCCRFG